MILPKKMVSRFTEVPETPALSLATLPGWWRRHPLVVAHRSKDLAPSVGTATNKVPWGKLPFPASHLSLSLDERLPPQVPPGVSILSEWGTSLVLGSDSLC